MTVTQPAAPALLPRWAGSHQALAVSGGLIAGAGVTSLLTSPAWALQLSLVSAAVLAVSGGATLFESLRAGRGAVGIGSCVFAVVLWLAVYVSGSQLVDGERESILQYFGLSLASGNEDTLRAAAIFVLAAGAFAFGEGLFAARMPASTAEPRQRVTSYRQVYVVLLVFGVAVTLLTGQRVDAGTLELRGQVSGQGVVAVLQQTLPLAIAIGILFRHWGRSSLVGLSAVGLAVYSTVVQSRSLLLFVGLAVVIRLVNGFAERRVTLRDVAGLLGVTYVAALFIVAFGQWRSAVRTFGSSDFLPWLGSALPFPWQELSRQGSLDTLDGLVLSTHVDRATVGASVLDPLKGFTSLVPSQVWSDKPEFLGPEITHAYTNFGGRSGLFLSGPGYLYVVFAGLVGMTVACLVLGVGIASLVHRCRRSPVLTLVILYGLCRFLIGGDAFDLHYALTLLISLSVGVAAVRVGTWLSRGTAAIRDAG